MKKERLEEITKIVNEYFWKCQYHKMLQTEETKMHDGTNDKWEWEHFYAVAYHKETGSVMVTMRNIKSLPTHSKNYVFTQEELQHLFNDNDPMGNHSAMNPLCLARDILIATKMVFAGQPYPKFGRKENKARMLWQSFFDGQTFYTRDWPLDTSPEPKVCDDSTVSKIKKTFGKDVHIEPNQDEDGMINGRWF